MEKVKYDLPSGNTGTFIDFENLEIKTKYRRKTRQLDEAEAVEEIIWLIAEDELTDSELKIIDDLSEQEFIEFIQAVSALKK